MANWSNASTKDISLPSVVHVGSGLLEILDVVVPGLLVLSGDGKEKKYSDILETIKRYSPKKYWMTFLKSCHI